MIVEKPMWLRHAGLQIFSLDIQPSGLRFATAGGDHKVRIWNMKPLAERDADSDSSSANKLLATLRDHFGSVNCVRWAKCGRLIASGSDDQVILVHERRPGSGTTEFGSGEPPDVENWKVLLTLRGHTADVVDLGWSPDDSLLASCSLDNTARVWQAATGSPVAVLTGHHSLVKGLTWDPIGSFLATQSDDKTVIIWRTSNWGLVQRIEGPYDKTVGSTFFRRLGWSPCGHFIATTHGFQNPSHTAPVLERGEWLASFDFVGHNAPVVAVRFNHSMFRKQVHRSPDGKEGADAGNGASTGTVVNGTSSKPKDALPYNVIAIGSQDCCISVWTTGSPRPVFIGKHFFTQSVVDLSWSPDGYTLFCCSLDGTVASFHFEAKELGQKISDSEMEEFKKSRYGDVRACQVMLAESPAQLVLEAAAAKQWGSVNPTKAVESVSATATPAVALNGAPRPEGAPKVAATETKIPNGRVVTSTTAKAIPSLVKQTEYRRPDGRRRIIPEPLGPPAGSEDIGNNVVLNGARSEIPDVPASDFRNGVDGNMEDPGRGVIARESDADNKRSLPEECMRVDMPAAKRSNNAAFSDAGAPMAHPSPPEAVAVGPNDNAPASVATAQEADMVITPERTSSLKGVLSIRIQAPEAGGEDAVGQASITLESKPIEGSDKLGSIIGAGGSTLMRESLAKAEIVCSQGGMVRWRDRLLSLPTALAGNTNFWAVACSDGILQLYTMAGRRSQLSMVLGSPAAFMDCNQGWRLLVVTKAGSLHLWDLQESKLLLHESLSPLLSLSSSPNANSKGNGSLKVVSARLSQAGVPLVVLANQHAFLFHLNMRCWQRVADETFPASNFVTTWPDMSTPAAEAGELASIQAGVTSAAGQTFIWNRSSLEEEKWQTRAHLEIQMTAAQALQSASEYRRFLLAYSRCLAREADEARLRELCEELLGPTYAVDSSCPASPCSKHNKKQWNPEILGMKKRELLKSEVLPAMASNRAIQRLLNEFVDLLSECKGLATDTQPTARSNFENS
ncbi:hypothetical protein CY35_01G027300 [Sphagnum magellanicum]|nr:hypothetical protein CY35_01G027300 [Sphagnum magellanicum]